MYSLINALARGESISAKNFNSSSGVGSSDAFEKIFNSFKGGSTGIQDLLSKIQERFPGAKVKEGEVPAGIEESKKAAEEDGDKVSDKVNMSSSLLESMLGNSGLAKMVEDAISSFLDNTGSGGMMNMNGAYVQRSVTITITTVRYTEMQRSQETGDILGASELQTSLQDKIKEMMQQLFGGGNQGEETDADAEGSEKTKDKTASNLPSNWGGSSVSMWSMELFYSMTSIQGQNGGSGSSASGSFSSFQFSASYSSFTGLTSNQLPSLLSQYANGGSGSSGTGSGSGSGSGGLAELLEEALANFGLSGSSYRQSSEGFSFKLSQSRNLIAELMELYGDRIGGNKNAYETDPAAEADAGVAEEQPAEAVGAAE